jgi:DNA-binding GntR family transcriptional regulator
VSVHVPLREKAYETLRAELLDAGPEAFGGRLVEQQLAAELQMSRTPIRDALRRLAVAGLIEEVRGGGYAPRRPSVRDIREQYEIRLLLEVTAAESAAARPPRERQASLRDTKTDGGTTFHLALAEASSNAILARSIATINERCFLLRLRDGLDASAREHLRSQHAEILAAVRDGDASTAATCMRTHLRDAQELAIAAARALRQAAEEGS